MIVRGVGARVSRFWRGGTRKSGKSWSGLPIRGGCSGRLRRSQPNCLPGPLWQVPGRLPAGSLLGVTPCVCQVFERSISQEMLPVERREEPPGVREACACGAEISEVAAKASRHHVATEFLTILNLCDERADILRSSPDQPRLPVGRKTPLKASSFPFKDASAFWKSVA